MCERRIGKRRGAREGACIGGAHEAGGVGQGAVMETGGGKVERDRTMIMPVLQ